MVSSRAYPDLDRSPKKNWVEKAGGLPDYIERIAKHIHYEGGKEIGTAISMAISQVRKWAAGGEGVSAKTQALAAKAIAAWEALKAKSKARTAVQMSARRIAAEVVELAGRGPYVRHVEHTKQFGRAKGNIKKPASWRHEYIPRNQVAGAIKAKHIEKADVDSSGHPKRGKSDEVKKPLPASAAIGGEGRKEQRSGAETAKTSNSSVTKTAKKPPNAATTTLKNRRNALERKRAAGTLTPKERTELSRLVTKLKSAS